jgi:hypothetical protein
MVLWSRHDRHGFWGMSRVTLHAPPNESLGLAATPLILATEPTHDGNQISQTRSNPSMLFNRQYGYGETNEAGVSSDARHGRGSTGTVAAWSSDAFWCPCSIRNAHVQRGHSDCTVRASRRLRTCGPNMTNTAHTARRKRLQRRASHSHHPKRLALERKQSWRAAQIKKRARGSVGHSNDGHSSAVFKRLKGLRNEQDRSRR